MTTTKNPTLADLVLELLSRAPRTGFELCRALEQFHGVALRGREGALYAALLEMEREGFVIAELREGEDGIRRWRYELPVLADVGDEGGAA